MLLFPPFHTNFSWWHYWLSWAWSKMLLCLLLQCLGFSLDCGRLSMIPVSENLVISFFPPSQVHLSSSDTRINSLLILDFPRGWSSAWRLTEQWKYSLVFGARTDTACSKDIYLDPALCQSSCSNSGHSEVLHFALELPVLGLVVLPHVLVESWHRGAVKESCLWRLLAREGRSPNSSPPPYWLEENPKATKFLELALNLVKVKTFKFNV